MTYNTASAVLIVASIMAALIPRDARRTIDAANHAWLAAMERQDAAAIAEPYADDSVFVLPTGESAHGRTAIEQLMRDRFEKTGPVRRVSLAQDGTIAVGSMIYEWGHADIELAHDGRGTATAHGRYLTVWRRDSEGRWRIIRNLSLPE